MIILQVTFVYARDEWTTVMHSNDAFAPVAYLNLTSMHLESKSMVRNYTWGLTN